MNFEITDLKLATDEIGARAAELLVVGFEKNWPGAWPTLDSARAEVAACVAAADRVNRIALDASGRAFGWVGAKSGYRGKTWSSTHLSWIPSFSAAALAAR